MLESGTADNPLLLRGTDYQLEKFLMLGPFVTGKTAAQQQPKLNQFLKDLASYDPTTRRSPLAAIKDMNDDMLLHFLKKVKAGQYTRLTKCLRELAESGLNYRTCTREDLIQIHGISMKSSSFFLMYTQDADVAVWDTHLLKWAANDNRWFKLFHKEDIPKSTPGKKVYLELEHVFLDYCKNQVHKRPHELDFAIWSAYRRKIKS